MLPLINKRWARVLRGGSHAWRVVTLGRPDWDEEEDAQWAHQQGDEGDEPLNAATVLDWFISRPG